MLFVREYCLFYGIDGDYFLKFNVEDVYNMVFYIVYEVEFGCFDDDEQDFLCCLQLDKQCDISIKYLYEESIFFFSGIDMFSWLC